MKARLIRLLWLAPTLLSVAYFAFWACAPAAYLDPPLAKSGPQGVVGAAAVYSNESLPSKEEDSYRPDGFDGQLWFQRRFERLGFGLTAAVGQSALISGGGYLRLHLVEEPHFRMATDFQLGGVFVGVALPMVRQINADLEWYVAPWLSMRAGQVLRLPTGLRYWTPGGGAVLSVEAGGAAVRDDFSANRFELWGALAVGIPLFRN